MKLRNRILEVFIACLLLPTSGFTQAPPFAVAPTPGNAINPLSGAGSAAVDTKGAVRIGAADVTATGLGKAEDSVAASGDTGVMALAVRTDGSTVFAGADGDYSAIGVSQFGSVKVNVEQNGQTSATSSLLKSEDSVASSGDAGIAAWGVNNQNLSTTFNSGATDYTPLAVDNTGAVYTHVVSSAFVAEPGRREDDTIADTQAVLMAGFQREDALTVNTSTTGDVTYAKVDANGRLITTLAPAGETFQSCGTATAVTSDVAIKAAVASNRIYVTAITCKNTSTTVGPTLDFKDNTTIIAVGGIPATSATGLLTGEYHVDFPVPLRGTSNTAFNFATNTATTSVTCCASGYVSVN